MSIINTSQQGERGRTLGADPHAIEQQERQGQRELAADTALPTEGLSDPAFAAMGVVVLNVREADPLFSDVRLPPGWRVQPTDHDMWSHLIDDHGEKRAHIFYKAASYDRRAFIRPGAE